jgi:hypothetical protein
MATLIKNLLNAPLAVYVEYSNEVWNWVFAQSTWNYNEAVDMVNNEGWGSVLAYDGSENTYEWGFRRIALSAKMISDLWRQVWGDCAINDRVRVVFAAQVIWNICQFLIFRWITATPWKQLLT